MNSELSVSVLRRIARVVVGACAAKGWIADEDTLFWTSVVVGVGVELSTLYSDWKSGRFAKPTPPPPPAA